MTEVLLLWCFTLILGYNIGISCWHVWIRLLVSGRRLFESDSVERRSGDSYHWGSCFPGGYTSKYRAKYMDIRMATVLSGKRNFDNRRLTRDLNLLVVAMLEDGCSSTNCPEMRTLDCQYLCATHDKPRECPATDYILHTLDYTTALLNSSKLFPSRYTLRWSDCWQQGNHPRWTNAIFTFECTTIISHIHSRLRTS